MCVCMYVCMMPVNTFRQSTTRRHVIVNISYDSLPGYPHK